jgi:hypothetical protein
VRDAGDGDGETGDAPEAGVPDSGVDPARYLAREGPNLRLQGEPFVTVGVNQIDLLTLFLGVTRSGARRDELRARALAALDDAAAAGFTVVRCAGVGYWPADVQQWRAEPPSYWQAFDEMVAAAQQRGLKLVPVLWWNPFLFADLTGEPLSRTFDASSLSAQLLEEYVVSVGQRYAAEETVLYWELTHGLNDYADMNFGARVNAEVSPNLGTPESRSGADNFTTDQMVATVVKLARALREVDANHLISSGFALPKPYAMHLRAHPEWEGADWRPDSLEELQQYVALTHPEELDLVSVHLFNDGRHRRFDITGRANPAALALLHEAALLLDKPLVLGAFGDETPPVQEESEATFARRAGLQLYAQGIPLAFHWLWEFVDFGSPATAAASISPTDNADLVSFLNEMGQWLDQRSQQTVQPLALVNASFEQAGQGGLPAAGWQTVDQGGPSTGSAERRLVGADAFQGQALLRLTRAAGDPSAWVYVLSDAVEVTGNGDVVLSAALRRDLYYGGQASVSLVQYDDQQQEIAEPAIELGTGGEGRFRIEHARFQLNARARTVRVRVGLGGYEGATLEVDDLLLWNVLPIAPLGSESP